VWRACGRRFTSSRLPCERRRASAPTSWSATYATTTSWPNTDRWLTSGPGAGGRRAYNGAHAGVPKLDEGGGSALRPPSGPRASAPVGDGKLHKAEQMSQRLDAHVDSTACSHPIPQALQTHTCPLTQAAACPAARHAERTGTTTSQRDGTYMRYSSIYAKPVRACGRTTSPVVNFNYVYSQN
jgi:hypothetical protein